MKFGLVGFVELRIKAGLVRFRIGCLGCVFGAQGTFGALNEG